MRILLRVLLFEPPCRARRSQLLNTFSLRVERSADFERVQNHAACKICDSRHLANRPGRRHSYRQVTRSTRPSMWRPTPMSTTAPSSPELKEILDAVSAGDTAAEAFAALPLPEAYRAVTVHADETAMFEGLATREKDPRAALHLDEVPLPELGP